MPVKSPDTSTAVLAPALTLCGAAAPAAIGVGLVTVTLYLWVAAPLALVVFLAVTVIVALPARTPVIVRMGPFIEAAATDVLEDDAE